MDGKNPRSKTGTILSWALTITMAAVAAPLLVTLVLILHTLARCRAARPGAVPSGIQEKVPGVKTMSEVMEALCRIPFKARVPRLLATLAVLAQDAVPMVLNTNRATTGFIYPYPDTFEPEMIESQDGTPICCLLALQPGKQSRPALILVHGLFATKNTRSIQSLALSAYYDWGFHVLALDLRDHGDSGRFSDAPVSWGYRESDDIMAAAEYLESIEAVSTVGVCGVSMGATSALLAAARSRLDRPLAGGVVALNGYSDAERALEYISTFGGGSLDEMATGLFFRLMLLIKTVLDGPMPLSDFREYVRQVTCQYYEATETEVYAKASPVNYIREVEVPCLAIHAEDDQVVPVLEAEDLAAAAADNPMFASLILPRGGHALYGAVSRRWFRETLRTFFTYWGEFEVGVDSEAGTDSLDMFGNPNN